jgi:putative ABC transport system substrate-binding protein
MKRREFIALFGAAAAVWPRAARAQQVDRIRRIGVLMPCAQNDPETSVRVAALHEGLLKLGDRGPERPVRISLLVCVRS